MSATEAKPKPGLIKNNQINPSYTVRVICCVFFIFVTELCLAHYIYRLINSEVRSDYVQKCDFHQNLVNEMRTQVVRDEILRILKEFEYDGRHNGSALSRTKRNTHRSRHHAKHNWMRFNAQNEDLYRKSPNTLQEMKDERQANPSAAGVGVKGAAGPGGDSYIWLSSSSRIPEKTLLEEYCKKVHESCPPGQPGRTGLPGEPGVEGQPGPKGDRGDKGFPGVPGIMGNRGLPGYPGEKGEQGRPGLDGRDGIPGEPGLYGTPGRNGNDGLPGNDGIPGRNGQDGINGLKGEQGPPGPVGPPGQRGLTGPRGRPGKAGSHGTPGIPGITAWKTMGTSDSAAKLLIGPSIAGGNRASPIGPIVVHEGDNVRLHCSSTGTPSPHITWQRVDSRPINRGSWQDVYIAGPTLNITRVNREHMGLYLCIADNGVPPQANQTFNLEVYFPPLIRISNQMVGTVHGSTAVLECETEAFPEPLRYWERSDGRLLENGDKFRIDNSVEKDGYKHRMQLNITRITANDCNYRYICISKNELQTTRGEFIISEIDPSMLPPPRVSTDRRKETIFGVQAPDKVSLEDLCGPPIQCPECDSKEPLKCTPSGVSLIDLISRWEIRPFGEGKVYPGVGNRSTDCVLYAVGKPVYHRFTEYNLGSWLRDPNAQNEKDYEKFWVTNDAKPNLLFEYDNKTMFRRDVFQKQYDLDYPFSGNGHVVYNGHFYYNVKDTSRIMKYNLHNKSAAAIDLPVPANYSGKLYVGQYNYMDFSIDDNGLWVIFPVPDSNNTAVMKVDVDLMKPQYIWNVSLNHHKVGEMFIVCGVLYAVDSAIDRNTKIRFALDLYKNSLLDVSLTFSNPFRKTTMIGYNHRNKELYSWDKGNQLTYPVRYHEIGYNLTAKDELKSEPPENPTALMQTGYSLYKKK